MRAGACGWWLSCPSHCGPSRTPPPPPTLKSAFPDRLTNDSGFGINEEAAQWGGRGRGQGQGAGRALSILRSTPGWVAALILRSEPQFPVCKVRFAFLPEVEGSVLTWQQGDLESGCWDFLAGQSVVKNQPSSAGDSGVPSPGLGNRSPTGLGCKPLGAARSPCAILQDPTKIYVPQLRPESLVVFALARCVTQHKFLNLSETHFLIFKKGSDRNLPHLVVVGKAGPVDQTCPPLVYLSSLPVPRGFLQFLKRLQKKLEAEQYIVAREIM